MTLDNPMNWLSPICSFLQSAFLKLSKVDGKDGLSVEDFQGVLKIVRNIHETWGAKKTGGEKAALVAGEVLGKYDEKVISAWIVHILVWLAHSYASRKGFLK